MKRLHHIRDAWKGWPRLARIASLCGVLWILLSAVEGFVLAGTLEQRTSPSGLYLAGLLHKSPFLLTDHDLGRVTHLDFSEYRGEEFGAFDLCFNLREVSVPWDIAESLNWDGPTLRSIEKLHITAYRSRQSEPPSHFSMRKYIVKTYLKPIPLVGDFAWQIAAALDRPAERANDMSWWMCPSFPSLDLTQFQNMTRLEVLEIESESFHHVWNWVVASDLPRLESARFGNQRRWRDGSWTAAGATEPPIPQPPPPLPPHPSKTVWQAFTPGEETPPVAP